MNAAEQLAENWPAIAALVVWKLGNGYCLVTRKDLKALPLDRVLVTDTTADEVRFRWITPARAHGLSQQIARSTGGKEKANVTQLDGRWQKIAVVLLWQLAKDGWDLKVRDQDDLPADKIMLTHAPAHGDTLEFRWVPRAEAASIQKWEKDNEGRIVTEVMQ